MLGEVDYSLLVEDNTISIAKPNGDIISKVPEAYGVNHKQMITELNTLEFSIPYYLEHNGQRIRNKNADLIRERYRVKYETPNLTEWYIVMSIDEDGDESSDIKTFHCEYLPRELADRYISGYQEDSKGAREVLNDILSLSAEWSIGHLDADFELSKRSWDFTTKTTLLEAVYAVFEKYNAIIDWDTVNREVNMIKPELHGVNRLGTFSRDKYLKSVSKKSGTESIITRLRPKGKDGLSIERVNEGSPYLEDYRYWMYPFERNNDHDVLNHSYYMSDSLCHAILDYKDRKESYKDSYKTFIEQRDGLTENLSLQQSKLINLKNELAAMTQIRLSQQFNDLMFLERFNYQGVTHSIHFPHPEDGISQLKVGRYGLFVWMKNANNVSMSVAGFSGSVQSGKWILITKIPSSSQYVDILFTGTGNSDVYLQLASLSEEEYIASGNDNALIQRYCFNQKEIEISEKEAEIKVIEQDISSIDFRINDINTILLPTNNFSQEQLEELDKYILEEEYIDETLIDEKDVLSEGQKRFDEYKIPQLEIDIDIIDFTKCLEEQRNWKKLYLGDKVRIKYEVLGDLYVEAKIIGIEHDHESPNINLTIANFKNVNSAHEILEKYIYDTKTKTDILGSNIGKWNQAVVDSSDMSKLFDHFWDKITNQINMAVNQTVNIGENGITVYDDNDPLRFLRLTNGGIGLTRSGGLKYETAISADGNCFEVIKTKIINIAI